MEMIADEIKQNGVAEDNTIYLDLDKRENRKIKTPDQLEVLIESKIKNQGLNYLFIDEVQNVTGFEEVINGFRSDGGFSIFITGSNSYLLSGELVTNMKSKKALTGEKKYYLADLSFYFAQNTDNRINFGPVLENIVYIYSCSLDYSVSVGRIGKPECDFILRNTENDYSYVQVAYTIMQSEETENSFCKQSSALLCGIFQKEF